MMKQSINKQANEINTILKSNMNNRNDTDT